MRTLTVRDTPTDHQEHDYRRRSDGWRYLGRFGNGWLPCPRRANTFLLARQVGVPYIVVFEQS